MGPAKDKHQAPTNRLKLYVRAVIESEVVYSAKYLGVTIIQDLNWNNHIYNITENVNRTLGYIKRNVKTRNEAVRELSITNGIVSSKIYDKWDDFNFEYIKVSYSLMEMFLAPLPMVYIFLSLFPFLECVLMLMTSTMETYFQLLIYQNNVIDIIKFEKHFLILPQTLRVSF